MSVSVGCPVFCDVHVVVRKGSTSAADWKKRKKKKEESSIIKSEI